MAKLCKYIVNFCELNKNLLYTLDANRAIGNACFWGVKQEKLESY